MVFVFVWEIRSGFLYFPFFLSEDGREIYTLAADGSARVKVRCCLVI